MSYVAVVTVGGSIISSAIGGARAKQEAKKQRELQKAMFLASKTSEEKFKYDELKQQGELARTQILADSLGKNREALYKESTKRLSDTWIYVAGSGLGISLIYGMSIVANSYTEKE